MDSSLNMCKNYTISWRCWTLNQDAKLDTASSLCCHGGIQVQACLGSWFRKLVTPMLPPGSELWASHMNSGSNTQQPWQPWHPCKLITDPHSRGIHIRHDHSSQHHKNTFRSTSWVLGPQTVNSWHGSLDHLKSEHDFNSQRMYRWMLRMFVSGRFWCLHPRQFARDLPAATTSCSRPMATASNTETACRGAPACDFLVWKDYRLN